MPNSVTLDQTGNFGLVNVSTGYDASAVTIVLSSGEGSNFPDPASGEYNVTWWDSTNYAIPSDDPNVEIVRVTAKATDTLTVTRNQEGSGASTKNTGGAQYKMLLGVTKKMMDDIQTGFSEQWKFIEEISFSNESGTKAFTTITSPAASMLLKIVFDAKDTSASANTIKMTLNGFGGTSYDSYYMNGTTLGSAGSEASMRFAEPAANEGCGGEVIIKAQKAVSNKVSACGNIAMTSGADVHLITGQCDISTDTSVDDISIVASGTITGTFKLYRLDT